MKIFAIICLFFSLQSWGQQLEYADATPLQYTIKITENSVVYGCYSDPCPNELVFEEAESASGTTPVSTVYVPMYDEFLNLGYDPQTATNTIVSNIKYSIFTQVTPNSSTPTNTLPSYDQNAANTSTVKHEFSIKNTSTADMYVYASIVKLPNVELQIIGSDTTANYSNLGTINRNSSGDYWIKLPIYDLCTIAGNSSYPSLCVGLKSFDPTDVGPHYPDVQIYFFLSSCSSIPDVNSNDSNCKNPPPPTTTAYPGGIYFKYFLGNIVNTIPPIINTLAKGDERAKITYSGDGIKFLNDVIAIKYPGSATSTDQQTYYNALLGGGVIGSRDNGANTSGNIILKNLVNGVPFQVGLAYVNKFNFASEISAAEEQTPEQIQTFLQAKECYLLSAGFQKDHYVLEYFRKFRDNFLLKNIWGRSFVKWYYRTAPFYAGIIYENNFLRFVVRSLGYMAYFSLRFFPFLLSFFLIFTFWKFAIIRE